MNVLLVGNKGALLDETELALLKFGHSVIVIVLSLDVFLEDSDLECFTPPLALSIVVYVGGEVRDKARMEIANIIVPKRLLDYASKRKARFVYLSTLAVYPLFPWPNVVGTGPRFYAPIGQYGSTKAVFDRYAEQSEVGFSGIQPASIVGSERLESSLDKTILALIRYPILRFIDVGTVIGFCERSEVVNSILDIVSKERNSGFVVLSHDVAISRIQSAVYQRRFRPIFRAGPLIRIAATVLFKVMSIWPLRISYYTNQTRFTSNFSGVDLNKDIEELVGRRVTYIRQHLQGM